MLEIILAVGLMFESILYCDVFALLISILASMYLITRRFVYGKKLY